MDVTNFVTASDASAQAFKTATLLKTLSVNSLITGESGVGKKSLAKYILPDAQIIDASDFDHILVALENSREIIISNLENSPNLIRLIKAIQQNNVRVVATAKSSFFDENIDDLFSLQFDIPPLSQRLEDVDVLVKSFIKEAALLFNSNEKFDLKNFQPDLSQNSNSLRRQVMISYLLQDIKDVELMDIIDNYLYSRLGSNSDYRNFLYLYEVPLIKSGLRKFKSQLKLADKLGLNRNTLRKKISDNKQYI
ncbi:MAG: Fis family transcriptional regulator [Sulfurimonas sp.]|nr:Fis family transcriptional regulator [Sulfurimonas sp.]MBU1215986.1 Fis family transcriptional regulator [bacterium]MBU1435665.1 Fis family transcriptional regulator [bacterium]MBU1502411.1 Fis family transcriptional regulator [bacterium]MBU3939329.1 Fis family transcriptional regulator [bacterium]